MIKPLNWDELTKTRYWLAISCNLTIIILLMLFSLQRLNVGDYFFYTLNSTFVIFSAVNVILLIYKKKIDISNIILALILGPFFLFLFFTGGVESTGYLFGLTYPVFVFFLMGKKGGTIASTVFFLAVFLFFVLSYPANIPAFYTQSLRERYLCLYIAVSVLTYSSALLQSIAHRHLKKEIEATHTLNADLVQSKEHIELLFATVPSAVYVVDTKQHIIKFNKKAEELTGYTKEEVIGKLCTLWTDTPCKNYCSLFQDGNTSPFENKICTIRRKDGEIRTIQKNAKILHDENNVAYGAIESFTDITDHINLTDQLRKAKELAEATTFAKSSFLANMSHEIRTPMNGIIGLNSILIETELTVEQRDLITSVQKSAEALLTILDDILDYSKIEAGRLTFDAIDFDLRATIEGAMELIAYKAIDKQVEIITLVHSSVPNWVRGDPGRLRQIILNLAGNAVKFTEKGEVSLILAVTQETASHVTLRFEVRDTGIGISAENQKKLFQEFSQVDPSTTRLYGGTGLGLAISKRLSELMGGSIGVISEEGKGSTFYFIAIFEKQTQHSEKTPTVPADISGLKILIAEPSSTGHRVLQHYMQSWGCRSEVIDDPHAVVVALAKANQEHNPFDIAIISMIQNGISGMQLAKLIKAEQPPITTKIIVLTAVGNRGDAQKMKDIGIAAYLMKPIKYHQLRECIIMLCRVENAAPARDNSPVLITRHMLSEQASKKRFHILLAEDNLVNQKVVSKILEKCGHSCDIANNGIEAVQAFCTRPYDLVLMDCQMPVLSGFDATRSIREDEAKNGRERIPIIALTANVMKGDKEKCIEMGMDEYLSKPITTNQLKATLEKWLHHEEPDRQNPICAENCQDEQRTAETCVVEVTSALLALDNDREIYCAVVITWLSDTPTLLDNLSKTLIAGDLETCKRHAHSLKSTSRTVGAMHLGDLAQEIECSIEHNDAQALNTIIQSIENEFTKVKDVLLSELGRLQ